MRRTDVVVELLGSVDVPKSRTGGIDPVNDAIRYARRNMDTPYSPDADRVEYEAVDHGDYYTVVARGLSSSSAFSRRGDAIEGAAGAVDRGTFESKDVVEHRTVGVADELARLTVADLRELGREHDVSYGRGSTKDEMIEQLIEQRPELARSLARD